MDFRPVPPVIAAHLLTLSGCNHSEETTSAIADLRASGTFQEYQRQLSSPPVRARQPHFTHTLKAYAEDGRIAASIIVVTGGLGEVLTSSLVLQVAYCETVEHLSNACNEVISRLVTEFKFPITFKGGQFIQDWVADGCPSAKVVAFGSNQTEYHPAMALELFAYTLDSGGWRLVLDWTATTTR